MQADQPETFKWIVSQPNCEELVVVSPREPKHRPFYLKHQDKFISSLNCIVFNYQGVNYGLTNMYDLRHIVPLVNSVDLEDANQAQFFLFETEQVKLVKVIIDHGLVRFYEGLISRNNAIKVRVNNFNPDANQLAAFGIFHYTGSRKFSPLSSFQNPPVQLGEDLMILSNSFSLSFKELFSKNVNKAICSSLASHGVFATDLRGFPDIEGALIYSQRPQTCKENKNQSASNPTSLHDSATKEFFNKSDHQHSNQPSKCSCCNNLPEPVGFVIPGIFHKNNYREYLTIGYSLSSFIPSFIQQISSSTKPPLYSNTFLNRIGTVSNHLTRMGMNTNHQDLAISQQSQNLPQAVNFWLDRMVKTAIYSPVVRSYITASGIAINRRLILTNKHALEGDLSKLFVVHKGQVFSASKVISVKAPSKKEGTLDVQFFLLDNPLPIADLSASMNFADIFALGLQEGAELYTMGFPSTCLVSYTEESPYLSKGHLLKQYTHAPLKEPVLLLFNCLIFSGNSGGVIIDSHGRMAGVVFANLSIGEPDSRTGVCVINEMVLGVSFLNDIEKLWQLVWEKDSQEMESIISSMSTLLISDVQLEKAAQFCRDRTDIQRALERFDKFPHSTRQDAEQNSDEINLKDISSGVIISNNPIDEDSDWMDEVDLTDFDKN